MEISERSVVDFLKDTNNIQYGHAGKVMPIDVSKLGKLVWMKELGSDLVECRKAFTDHIGTASLASIKKAMEKFPHDALLYTERVRTGDFFCVSFRVGNFLYLANANKGPINDFMRKDETQTHIGGNEKGEDWDKFIEQNKHKFEIAKGFCKVHRNLQMRNWKPESEALFAVVYPRFSANGTQAIFKALGIKRSTSGLRQHANIARPKIRYIGTAQVLTFEMIRTAIGMPNLTQWQVPEKKADNKNNGSGGLFDTPEIKKGGMLSRLTKETKKENEKGMIVEEKPPEVETVKKELFGEKKIKSLEVLSIVGSSEAVEKMRKVAQFLIDMEQSATKELRNYFLPFGFDLAIMKHSEWIKAINKIFEPVQISNEKIGLKQEKGKTQILIKMEDIPKLSKSVLITFT